MEIVLLWCFVLAWMAKRGAEDLVHAVKGTTNPRYELKKAKAIAAGKAAPQQPRYGGREWFADLLSDGLAAQTEHRRAKAKAKAQPVDDMVDVVREPRAVPGQRRPARHPNDPNNTRNCPTCKGEVVLDGRPCPRCLAEQQRRNAEWEAQRVPAEQEPQRRTSWASPEAQETAIHKLQETAERTLKEWDPEMWKRTHQRDASADAPTAQIIQFPNPKQIEKEITMANSEVTGLSTAMAFAEMAANAHESFANTGAEGYVGALERGGMGDGATASAREAMEASGIAADKWAAHKAALEQQVNLREAYQAQPDAADKEFLLAE